MRQWTFRDVLEALGRGLGAILVPRAMQDNKNGSLALPWDSQRSPRGSKIEPKSLKSVVENHTIFDHDFEVVVYRFWLDSGSKNLSKIGGLRVVISTSLRICEKCDF